jgi:hypothetical protein
MTLVALLLAGFLLGVTFNVYVLLALVVGVIPTYFVGSLHLGVLQGVVSTLLAVTVFEFGYASGLIVEDRFLRRLPAGPNWESVRRRFQTIGGLNRFPSHQTHVARLLSFFRPVSEFFATAMRLLVVAAQFWRGPL